MIDELEFYKAAIRTFPRFLMDNAPDFSVELHKSAWGYVHRCEQADQIFKAKVLLVSAGQAFLDEDGFYLNMNDMFAWGCADAEEVPDDEVLLVYKIWKEVPGDGLLAWACHKRGQMPQEPVLRKREGFAETMQAVKALMEQERDICRHDTDTAVQNETDTPTTH